MKFLNCRKAIVLVTALTLVAFESQLEAQENDFWINPAGGFYISFVNWGDETSPGALDTANFDLDSLYEVDWIDQYNAVAALNVTNGNVLFRSLGSDTGGPIYEMPVSGDVNVSDSIFFIGFGDESHRLSVGDELIVENARLEIQANSTLQVNDAATFGSGSEFGVGDSIVDVLGNVLFGIGADGGIDDTQVEIQDGAIFSVGGLVDVGSAAGSEVVAIVDGGSVAFDGWGLFVGAFADSSGQLNVTDAGSMWESNSTIRIGRAGDGALNITSGGAVTGVDVIVGDLEGSTGTILVTGEFSTLNASEDIQVGLAGNGLVNLRDSGLLSAASQILIGETGEIDVNQPGGFATITAGDGLVNNGLLDLQIGNPTINADTTNLGTIRSTSGSIARFEGSLVHEGVEIFTTSSASVRIEGAASGTGPYTGTGTTRFRADIEPGAGNGIGTIASISFEGNVEMIADTITQIEISGRLEDDFDRLLIGEDVSIDGELNVYDAGHTFVSGDEFVIVEIGGTRTGEFTDLPEGASVGIFDSVELFITYTGGDGNDIALATDGDKILLGDINLDGVVNLLDVGPFVALISSGMFQAEADSNGDGEVSLLDVGGFVDLLTG